MGRRKKFILIAVLVAVLLAGSTVGVVLAQDETDGATSQPIWQRVAAILGVGGTSVTAEQLEAAFTQARQEIRDEALDSRLKALVDAGTITQEQADQYKAWLSQKPDTTQFREQMRIWQNARPDVPSELQDWAQSRPEMPGLFGGFGPRGGMPGRFFGGR
jgi:uncharacterized protein HemX